MESSGFTRLGRRVKQTVENEFSKGVSQCLCSSSEKKETEMNEELPQVERTKGQIYDKVGNTLDQVQQCKEKFNGNW